MTQTLTWHQRNRERSREKCRKYYEKNREKRLAYQIEYRKNNLEKIKASKRKSYVKHRDQIRAKHKEWREHNKETINAHSKKYREANREKINARKAKRRYLLINHYSDGKFACACCGDTRYDGLEVDHINNDGEEHRKEIGCGGTKLISWLFNNDFPEGFQILCAVCNRSKGKHGVCRHDMPTPTIEDFP